MLVGRTARVLGMMVGTGLLVMIAACANTNQQSAHTSAATPAPARTAPPAPAPAAKADAPKPAVPAQAAAKNPSDRPGIHNVHPINDTVISGGVPEGDEGFDELKRMGVKTVISVDGASPDVKRAEARGMRYVHIPMTYAEVTPEQQAELARAIRDLPGPVFIHCHHGKHRSPAAVASAMAALGVITPEQGVAFMKKAGTAPTYEGLYACAAAAKPLAKAAIDAAPNDFPSIRAPKGITAAMVEIDEVFEYLKEVRDAEWTVPKSHPDLVPAALAGRLLDLLRHSGEDPKVKALGAPYQAVQSDAAARAEALEDALVAKKDKATLEPIWSKVAASCKECHVKFRDTVQ